MCCVGHYRGRAIPVHDYEDQLCISVLRRSLHGPRYSCP